MEYRVGGEDVPGLVADRETVGPAFHPAWRRGDAGSQLPPSSLAEQDA
ncbi:hypothetical protein ADILRU_2289 [Leifsonia rubra CMS 76R]|nr:hypothetical protein ADILRU_2289 [Leifsonia rubra CMS 76R]